MNTVTDSIVRRLSDIDMAHEATASKVSLMVSRITALEARVAFLEAQLRDVTVLLPASDKIQLRVIVDEP